jgi:hypothetical protein
MNEKGVEKGVPPPPELWKGKQIPFQKNIKDYVTLFGGGS